MCEREKINQSADRKKRTSEKSKFFKDKKNE